MQKNLMVQNSMIMVQNREISYACKTQKKPYGANKPYGAKLISNLLS
jgi:hypothetical protein